MFRFLLLLLLSHSAWSFTYMPWTPFPYELHISPFVAVEYAPSVAGDSEHGSEFITFQAIEASIAVTDVINTGCQLSFFSDRHALFNLEKLLLLGSYQFLDDIEGDVLSISAISTIKYTSLKARKKYLVESHSVCDIECLLSFGKEYDYLQNWVYRGYIATGLGVSAYPSLFFKTITAFEWNIIEDIEQLGFYVQYKRGLTGKKFSSVPHIGYGNTKYQMLDVFLAYTKNIPTIGTFTGRIGIRPFARLAPRAKIFLEIEYSIPLSVF